MQSKVYIFKDIRPDPIRANHGEIARIEEQAARESLRQAEDFCRELESMGDLPGQSRENWTAKKALAEARTAASEAERSRRLASQAQRPEEGAMHSAETRAHRHHAGEAAVRVENALLRTQIAMLFRSESRP